MSKHKDLHGTSSNVRQLAHVDVLGGGQITVENEIAYVGHVEPPYGTTILDVSQLNNIRQLAQLEVPMGMHSHKVRVHNNIMLINWEKYGHGAEEINGGLKIFDVSNPAKPNELAFFQTGGTGVHRFDFDGRYAYISPEVEGYVGNIVMIIDLNNPEKPEEIGRWWLPGQWIAGGETPTWEGKRHRCHHPLRLKDRLYVSYWHGGFVILDISNLKKPKMISRLDWSPPYPCPTHTALPIPHDIDGRKFMIVTDEEVEDRLFPKPSSFLWMVDITEEANPIPVSNWRIHQEAGFDPKEWFGAHQPQEQVYDNNIICTTWFAGGMRVLDIGDPYRPNEVGYFVPNPGKDQTIVQSNDVFVSPNGTIYLLDRLNGLDILEYTG